MDTTAKDGTGQAQLIIGISGKKQSGKNTAADQIADLFHGNGGQLGHILCFADYLKRFSIGIGAVTARQVSGSDADKNTPCAVSWEALNRMVEGLAAVYVPCVGRTGFLTAREWLEIFGTDIVRAMVPDAWIHAWRIGVDGSSASLILVPDVREPREVMEVQSRGGKVIRLLRDPCKSESRIETALDDYPLSGFDAVLNVPLNWERERSIAAQADFIERTVTPWLTEAGLI